MRRRTKTPTKWRITWFQTVDGVRRWRWHTGTEHECGVLRRACEAAGEEFQISPPGTFK